VKRVGDKWLDIDYIELEEQPLIYSRTIGGVKPSMEVFEYIDGTFTVTFHVEVEEVNLQKFMQVLALAGELGMMSMTRKGFGKFKCEVGILPEEAEHSKKRKAETRAVAEVESKKI
jgi:CRISPR/Cas system CMR-associated protein Cmr1 (group 7 of RAMP superfamily)